MKQDMIYSMPYGSFANANLSGNAANFSAFAPREFNLESMLSYPSAFNPSFISFTNLEPGAVLQDAGEAIYETGEILEDEKIAILCSPQTPWLCPFDEAIPYALSTDWTGIFAKITRTYTILAFALLLLGIGLYMLAKQTDEGKIIIDAGVKAATKGAI